MMIKNKKMERLVASYYPTKQELEELALQKFVGSYCTRNEYEVIMRTLYQAEITTIPKLHEADLSQFRKGTRRYDTILCLKSIIEAELK